MKGVLRGPWPPWTPCITVLAFRSDEHRWLVFRNSPLERLIIRTSEAWQKAWKGRKSLEAPGSPACKGWNRLESRVEKLVPVLRSWKSQDCLEIFLTSHESLDIDSRLVGKARRNEISQRFPGWERQERRKSSQRAPDIAWKGCFKVLGPFIRESERNIFMFYIRKRVFPMR